MKASYFNFKNCDLIDSEPKELPEFIFGCEPNDILLNRAVTWQLAARRSGCHKTKTRSEVSLTGSKPFRQKGTGRARQGSNKAVHMRKGGTVFGPVVRSHNISLPKKQRSLALRLALSKKAYQEKVFIVDDIAFPEVTTKKLFSTLRDKELDNVVFLYEGEVNKNFYLSARNIPNTKCLDVKGINVYDILKYKNVVFSEAALQSVVQRFGK